MGGIPFVGWAITFAALCSGLFAAILGAVTPELRAELGSYQSMGVLMMAWVSGGVLGAFQGGKLAQKVHPRTLVLAYIGSACCRPWSSWVRPISRVCWSGFSAFLPPKPLS